MPHDIGKTLKLYRNKAGISVKKISEVLTEKGFKASESTIYSWENGNSQPTPSALLIMCKAYGINDVLGTFGYNSLEGNEQPTTLAAHFDGDEYTEDELDEIRQFAEFVKGKRGK